MSATVRFDIDAMTDDELVRHVYQHARSADEAIDKAGTWDSAAVGVHERQAERALRELSKRDSVRANAIATELGWPPITAS